jgi:hypothetical protein
MGYICNNMEKIEKVEVELRNEGVRKSEVLS